MADFRRSIIVLAALALLLGTAGIVSAQPAAQFTCTANAATPPLVRGEGITELTGDLLLTCTGGTATGAGITVPTANIQIFLNTAITSRLISGVNDEALLMVDDPLVGGGVDSSGIAIAPQNPCPIGTVCPMWGLGATGGPSSYDGAPHTFSGVTRTNFNMFYGQQVPGNSGSIVWLGVPVDPPGTVRPTRVFRITNVRANAVAVGVSSTFTTSQILMNIAVNGNTSLSINNPTQIVAFVQRGLTGGELCPDVHRRDPSPRRRQAQATGAEQISEALLQLTGAAQQTVESLRHSTSAIDELNQVSGNLRSSVCRFKLEA
jgi:hypothetical protein